MTYRIITQYSVAGYSPCMVAGVPDLVYYACLVPSTIITFAVFSFFAWMGLQFFINN